MQKLSIFLAAVTLSALPLCGCGSDDGTPDNPQNGVDAGGRTDATTPPAETGPTADTGVRSDVVGRDGPLCGFDYSNYQPQAAPLTLKTDILPIMSRGCSLSSSCHKSGGTYPPNLGPGLVDGGVVATDMVISTIMASLNAPSLEAPEMMRVKKGDPENSFLMRKLDGSQSCGGLACMVAPGSPKPCGERMPGGDSSLPLDPDELKLFRDWIKQGAN